MITKIKDQIENINKSLEWIKNNKPADYNQKFIQLIELRRYLRRVLTASYNNPGIAAFGKSQVGKSYLISCLLQDNGKPFMVKAGDDFYNFVYKINPPSDNGGGKESTGVITRFSAFNRDPKRYSGQYPVLVKAFSVTDLILVIADSYFNDFSDYDKIMSDPRVIECINTPMPKPILTGDDLIAGGLKPNPLFKKMLRVAYRHQYEDNEIDKKRLFNCVKNIKE